MAKRKLEDHPEEAPSKKVAVSVPGENSLPAIQIITGSYECVLHGVTAWLPSAERKDITFSDAFLLQPHTSRITSVALSSASESGKRVLATGSSDERINLYQISSAATPFPKDVNQGTVPSKTGASQPSGNKELGSLLSHGAQVTKLWFAGRSKLLSAAEDNTIAVTRLRDMTTLSTIRAPLPKAQNRPSGDTAAAQDLPKGINGFAVHPSMKLMVSVGRGEKCMRLWNLVTGKKAGVLNFDRHVLATIGEDKFSRGEGVSVEWSPNGDEFTVAFERGALVFGMDARPRAKITTKERTKMHRIQYLPETSETNDGSTEERNNHIIAISTEDGRVIFFSTDAPAVSEKETATNNDSSSIKPTEIKLPECSLIGQLGGHEAGITSRIKDFEILQYATDTIDGTKWLMASACSDGSIRVWSFITGDLKRSEASDTHQNGTSNSKLPRSESENGGATRNTNAIGTLLGVYATENRLTCLTAYAMDPTAESPDTGEENAEELAQNANIDDSSEESSD